LLGLVIWAAYGPKPPLADVSDAASQLSHCGHSLRSPDFQDGRCQRLEQCRDYVSNGNQMCQRLKTRNSKLYFAT